MSQMSGLNAAIDAVNLRNQVPQKPEVNVFCMVIDEQYNDK